MELLTESFLPRTDCVWVLHMTVVIIEKNFPWTPKREAAPEIYSSPLKHLNGMGLDSYWSSCCSRLWSVSGIQAEISTDCIFGCWTLKLSSSILSNRRSYVAFVSCCISEWCVLATCLWMVEWFGKIWLQQHQKGSSLWLLSSFDATKAANDWKRKKKWVLSYTLAFTLGFLLVLYFCNIKAQKEC